MSQPRRGAQRFVEVVGWVVPADLRRDWRRDWHAELEWCAASGRGSAHEWRRARGAILHAFWLRAQRWRSDMFMQDIRDGIRALGARPALSLVAILTLALGIGANTAIFSVVHAVLLRELPYPNPDTLVSVYATNTQYNFDRGVERPEDIQYWMDHSATAAIVAPIGGGVSTVTTGGEPDRINYASVTPEFFQAMNVPPTLGRLFTAEETVGDARVVVVSDALWRSRLGAATDLSSLSIDLDGRAWRVIGVMPPDFKYPVRSQFWRPFDFSKAMKAWYLGSVVRLKPGVTVEAAQRDFDRMAAELEQQSPKARKGRGFNVVGLHRDLAYRSIDGLRLLQGVVALVLLIACANVANLLLAGAASRRREFSVRSALGASRARLVRQVLTESLVLAFVGAAIGAAIAVPAVRALVAAAPPFTLSDPDSISVSWFVLGCTAALAAGTAALFGLAPAVMLSSPNLANAMGQGARTASAGLSLSRRQYLRAGLVAAETALALVLLVGGGLLVRSFALLSSQETGFNTERFITAQITLPSARYQDADAQQRFWSTLLDRASALPGVTYAVASNALPFSNWEWQTDFIVEGRENLPNDGAGTRTVTPGYFEALGIPVLRGRSITAADRAGAEPVAFVSDVFVARHLPGIEPIGHRVKLSRDGTWLTIAGVVGSIRHLNLSEDFRSDLYIPLAQDPEQSTLLIGMRTKGNASALAGPLRQIVKTLDPQLPVQSVKTMEQSIGANLAERRFLMTLLALFAGLAAALAAIGVYGVMSFLVSQGRKEIGVRIALGARAAHVQRHVLGQGLRVVAIGAAFGLVASLWLTKLLKSQLFGTPPNDPSTLAVVTVLLLAAATLACWLPARRSSRVDPTESLRDS